MTKSPYEYCEDCGARLHDEIEAQNTLCNKCAAKKYWSLKAHIRNKLQYYAKLNKPVPQRYAEALNANYASGVGFERTIKHLLEDKGYYVMRSAGSHGLADLIAIKDGVTYIISCKRDFRPLIKIEPDKVKALLQVASNYENIVPIHAKRFNRVTTMIDLRTGNEVQL